MSPRSSQTRKGVRCLSDAYEIYIVGLVLDNLTMYLCELCQEIYHVTSKQEPAASVSSASKAQKEGTECSKAKTIALQAKFMALMRSYNYTAKTWFEWMRLA